MTPLRRSIAAYSHCQRFADNARFYVGSVLHGQTMIWFASARIRGRASPLVYMHRSEMRPTDSDAPYAFAAWLESVEDQLSVAAFRVMLTEISRRPERPDPYKGKPNHYEPGICMRQGCGRPRCTHSEKGELVLCQHHTEEVIRGDAKAPPLRSCIDYQSVTRPSFLVAHLPDPKDDSK